MRAALLLPTLVAVPALAQEPAAVPVPGDPIVVTATRTDRRALDVPASVDAIDARRIRDGQLQVNLSEVLPALPGVVANNRQNYAQDLQISIRGFGARSTFGVRGIRVVVDGIPATLPDGQGQFSHVDLQSAERIEVLRGPFSVLYGNSSGGVIDITSESGRPREGGGPISWQASITGGSDATRRVGASGGWSSHGFAALASANRFETDGYRDHSAARRDTLNAKARWELSPRTSVTFVGNALDMPEVQDPLGLSRAQFERDPRSVDPVALQFDTRKSVDQQQAGATLEHRFGAGQSLRFMAYGGQRGTQQYQAIPAAPQANALHPGGVIDLDRAYSGLDARWAWTAGGFSLVAGASLDRLDEDRRGFQNFVGSTPGVLGALRRDENNRVTDTGYYAQAEWEFAPAWRLLAGARATQVEFRSDDRYANASNPDDSGRVSFRATTPVAGINWRVAPSASIHAAAGRGFETPTTNELAYRPGGLTGLNFDLRPAKSDNVELGAKLAAGGWRATAALFRVDTESEIVVATNVGGRSTFRNAGDTRREGLELQAERDWDRFGLTASAAWLDATYREGFAATAGNRIPGVPRETAFAELRWRPHGTWLVALEGRHAGRIYVNDANTDSAGAYTVAGLRLQCTYRIAGMALRAFIRVDNLGDRKYAGSVIVNEGNSRFFEPAPGRTWLAGLTIQGGL
jgi:iron complex outermembrane receptor protein